MRDAASAGTLRRELGIGDEAPILMFTGRVRKSKGCSTLVEALSKIKDLPFHMVFVGKCKPLSYAGRLMADAERLGLAGRVHLYGFTPDVRKLINEADIGVAPSIVREACPLSPMEFMQAGKCIVATNNGAQPEYITDGKTGLLVPPADSEALATALRPVVSDAGLRSSLGSSAKEYFSQSMSYSAFLGKITDAYGDVSPYLPA